MTIPQLPNDHWLASDSFYNENKSNVRVYGGILKYNIISNIPTRKGVTNKSGHYGINSACLGYSLDIATMFNYNKAYYANAGNDGHVEWNDIPKQDVKVWYVLPYYEQLVDKMFEVAYKWNMKIDEKYIDGNCFIFGGFAQDLFVTKWKIQGLLMLYRYWIHDIIKELSRVSFNLNIAKLAELNISNDAEISLYEITDVKKMMAPIDMTHEFSVMSSDHFHEESHIHGLLEGALHLYNFIIKNPVYQKSPIVKSTKRMYLKIRSRHPSHDILRRAIRSNVNAVLRLGSETPVTNVNFEINTVEAVRNSADKRNMKAKFIENNVKTALYIYPTNENQLEEWIANNNLTTKKMIIKAPKSSRGRGIYLMQNSTEAIQWFRTHGYGNHIIEKYYNYDREYRLHVTKKGCFYTCRKMLKADATERWYRNDSNCVWIVEENPAFDKPTNWDEIVIQCVKALNAVGLDIGACDVRVSSKSNDFIICEINSAPSFGEITAQKYITQIQNILDNV